MENQRITIHRIVFAILICSVFVPGIALQSCNMERVFPRIFVSQTMQDTLEAHIKRLDTLDNDSGNPMITVICLYRFKGVETMVISSYPFWNGIYWPTDSSEVLNKKRICEWLVNDNYIIVYCTPRTKRFVSSRHRFGKQEIIFLNSPRFIQSSCSENDAYLSHFEYTIESKDSLSLHYGVFGGYRYFPDSTR